MSDWSSPSVLEWEGNDAPGAERPDWHLRASCRDTDPEIFFPADGFGVMIAQKICAGCPVRNQCLEYALANNEDHGVWGGTSERERRKIRRRRAIQARAS